jgi:Family of unknown function (DUF6082)
LILQSRQLKASQLQLAREMHLELIKFGIENPTLAATVNPDIDITDYPSRSYINFLVTFWETGYLLRTISKANVAIRAADLLGSEFARTWWEATARDHRRVQARTKIEKEFFTIIDDAFNDVMQSSQAANHPGVNSSLDEG